MRNALPAGHLRRVASATPTSSKPAKTNRMATPLAGGIELRPYLMASHVLPQIQHSTMKSRFAWNRDDTRTLQRGRLVECVGLALEMYCFVQLDGAFGVQLGAVLRDLSTDGHEQAGIVEHFTGHKDGRNGVRHFQMFGDLKRDAPAGDAFDPELRGNCRIPRRTDTERLFGRKANAEVPQQRR